MTRKAYIKQSQFYSFVMIPFSLLVDPLVLNDRLKLHDNRMEASSSRSNHSYRGQCIELSELVLAIAVIKQRGSCRTVVLSYSCHFRFVEIFGFRFSETRIMI